MPQPTALICGSSVAGLTLAYWLTQHGWHVTIVELAPTPRPGGYKIDLRGAAIQVAQQMNLLPRIRERAVHMLSTDIVNDRGRTIARLPPNDAQGRAASDVEIIRGDLIRILADAVTDQVTWRFGDSIDALAPSAERVGVTFTGGATATFDLIFGADGLHSRVRQLTFGAQAAHLQDLGAGIAVFSAPAAANPAGHETMYVAAPGRTVMTYRTDAQADTKVMLMFRLGPDSGRQTQDEQRRWLKSAFQGAGWQVPSLLQALDRSPDFYFDRMTQVQLPRYSAGRVALLGDAACCASPASGQGSSLAMVGAYVLAWALQQHPDHTQAFALYERTMRPFVQVNQHLVKTALPSMLPTSRAAIFWQLLFLKVMPLLPGQRSMLDKIVEPVQAAANALTLPQMAPQAPVTW